MEDLESTHDIDSESENTCNIDGENLTSGKFERQNHSQREDEREKEGIMVDKLKKDMVVEIQLKNGTCLKAQVVKRSGKATGKYKYWWYVRDLASGKIYEHDTENEWKSWKIMKNDVTPETREDHILHVDKDVLKKKENEINQAKINEYDKWIEERVIEEVADSGQDRISTTWVITTKMKENKEIVKARLVARGYEEEEKVRADSPTCMKESIRIGLAISMTRKWKIYSLDVKAAFLQGNTIEREVFLKPPKEFLRAGYVWKLRKVVYGLADASRSWYLKVKEVLTQLGMQVSKFDPAVFIFAKSKLEGLIMVHVDDILYFGEKSFMRDVIDPFKRNFKISREEVETFKYVGVTMTQTPEYITIDQKQYLSQVPDKLIPREDMKDNDRYVSDEEIIVFRKAVGQIGWLVNTSLPEAAFVFCNLSVVQSKPQVRDIKRYEKLVRDLKSSCESEIKIRPMNQSSLMISTFSDASFANLDNGASQLGYLVFIHDDLGISVPIAWASKKLKRVARSTLTAETLAAVEAIDRAHVIKKIVEEMLHTILPPVNVYIDSKSLYETATTSNQVADKRLLVDIASIREMVNNNEVKLHWVSTADQLADVMTKEGVNRQKLKEVLSNGYLSLFDNHLKTRAPAQ